MFGFQGFDGFQQRPTRFNTQYRCYSVSMLPGNERSDVEKGGKIIMPPSALDQLTRLNIVYPMLFKLTNKRANRETHSGVLEFVADEGKVYLPYWMMRNLLIEEGGILQVENASLPVATFSKFQPQSEDFLDITNPKAVLENALRNFACLTKGDVVAITYNEKVYELHVMEVKPGQAVSIIECDMNVEFAAPVGYQEPVYKKKEETEQEMAVDESDYVPDGFLAFAGQGHRLDGKKKGTDPQPMALGAGAMRRGIPNYEYKKGKMTFMRNVRRPQNNHQTEEDDEFQPFTGEGQALRRKGGRK
ncbi:ubiquitin recognition factor in ER-associated degradation protein 1-like [Branchiostoma lanceolatum]|uniref:Ubiquitin recognition factor in ER-associated degradation protein 1 n=1 Tax=Branchiostoma lanceolatum TaxID=7740 RepID=A0A8J9VUP3_BRALA|nr:UFD1L [Branchiostoma lanceolatum]